MAFSIPESEIRKTEEKIGIRFPEAFRLAMMGENGGTVIIGDDEWELHPFFDSSDRKRIARTSNDILRETGQAKGWGSFPSDGWAIGNNGCGDILFFKRSHTEHDQLDATVYVYRHEVGSIDVIAKDFSMLSKV